MTWPQTLSYTTSTDQNTTYSTYDKLTCLDPGNHSAPSVARDGLHQVVRIAGAINHATGTVASPRLVLRDANRVYKYIDLTATVSAVAADADEFVLNITGTANDFVDLTGHCRKDQQDEIWWYFGIAGAIGTSATAARFDFFPIRNA